MKKIMSKMSFAVIGMMATVSAFAAKANVQITVTKDMCALLERLWNVFNVLRIMAFVGAAFYIGSWAWDFISKGEAKMEDVKKKGIGLLVGFSLLFIIGMALTFVMSAAGLDILGCDIIKKW